MYWSGQPGPRWFGPQDTLRRPAAGFVARRALVVCLAAIGLLDCAASASAEPASALQSRHEPWVETWVGAETQPHAWAAYTGTTLAPLGSLDQPGLRVRIVTGLADTKWTTVGEMPGVPGFNIDVPATYRAHFAVFSVGMEWRAGPTTVKTFVGTSASFDREQQRVSKTQTCELQTAFAGVTGAIETWTNFASQWVLKLDVAGEAAVSNDAVRNALAPNAGVNAGTCFAQDARVRIDPATGLGELTGTQVRTSVRVESMIGYRFAPWVLGGVEFGAAYHRLSDFDAVYGAHAGLALEARPLSQFDLTIAASAGYGITSQGTEPYGRLTVRVRY